MPDYVDFDRPPENGDRDLTFAWGDFDLESAVTKLRKQSIGYRLNAAGLTVRVSPDVTDESVREWLEGIGDARG